MPRVQDLAMRMLIAAIALSCFACAPRMRCYEIGDLQSEQMVEVCTRTECRSLKDGKFIACPEWAK